MDLTFATEEGRFNVRAAAVITDRERLLVMLDERSPYYYIPGGRISFGESAEQAVLRELREELEIEAKAEKLLWVVESFFTEDVSLERYHELAYYFQIDISGTDLLERGDQFLLTEGERHRHDFLWMPFSEVETAYLYPTFLRNRIHHLPAETEHLVEIE